MYTYIYTHTYIYIYIHIYIRRQVSKFAVSGVAPDVRDVNDADLKSNASSSNKDAPQKAGDTSLEMQEQNKLEPGAVCVCACVHAHVHVCVCAGL